MSKLANNLPKLTIVIFLIFALTSQATAGGILFVDDDAPAAGDGTSWETAYRFLQDALTDASGGGISEIHVAQGTYKPDRDEINPTGTGDREATFHLLNGVAFMGGYAGVFAKDPDARDIEIFETILSGDLLGDDEPDFVNNDENSYHVTRGSDTDNTALLEGFSITAGNANASAAGARDRGGGFYAEPTDTTISFCKFENNFAAYTGGGLYVSGGSLNLLHTSFVENKVYREPVANGGGGVALSFGKFGKPTVDSCTFTGNSGANVGGGLFYSGYQFEGGVIITNCTFENNVATDQSWSAVGGGGIAILSSRETLIQDCVFTNNTASSSDAYAVGGGLAIEGLDSRVVNCKFSGNSCKSPIASVGGGILAQWTNPQFINCLVAGNSADSGGGINNINGSPTYINCTITGNTVINLGGAVYSSGTSTPTPLLINCIMWENGPEPIVDEDEAVTTVNYTNVQGGWSGAGKNNIDADPMFVNPGIGDYRLASGSPCIDAGHNWYVPVDVNDYDEDGILCELFPVDLDGNPRFNADEADFDPGCGIPVVVDMGAYEYQFDPVDQVTFADLNADGTVSTADLLILLASWGQCDVGCCLADLDIDGSVGTSDLLLFLANWGPCE